MWKSFSEAFLVCFSNQDLSSWFPVPYIQLPFGSFCLVYPTFWFIQNLNVSFFFTTPAVPSVCFLVRRWDDLGVALTKKVSYPWQLFICFIRNSGVQQGWLGPLAPKTYLAVSANSCWCHSWQGCCCHRGGGGQTCCWTALDTEELSGLKCQ